MTPRSSSTAGPLNATSIMRPRRSARLQNKPPVSICPAPMSPPVHTKRKRSHDFESETEANKLESVRLSQETQRYPSPYLELSEKNLKEFNKYNMGDEGKNAWPTSVKRSLSQRSITATSYISQDTGQSQRSSSTTAHYRYKHLAAAKIYIHTDPPNDIQDTIDAIFKAEPSEERRSKLKAVSKEFHNQCKELVKARVGEGDFVDLFRAALKAIRLGDLCLRENADWREELKPMIQQSVLNLSSLTNFGGMTSDEGQEVDDASAPPPKRQQQQSTGQTYISPQSSMTDPSNSTPVNRPLQPDNMPPPASRRVLDKSKEKSLIKTPRPDISIGIREIGLISSLSTALSSQNLDSDRAKEFLEMLEGTMMPSERGGPAEPLLIAVPAQRGSDLVFLFAVVEGKAYSTGKQVFEAQNQAAVSGACGLKMQFSLNELAKRSGTSSDVPPTPLKDPTPLFFSICTEGPYHELWAHFTYVENDIRKFNMTLLKICHGVLLDSVVDFIIAVDNVIRWGTGQFMESVVERLGKVAMKVGA